MTITEILSSNRIYKGHKIYSCICIGCENIFYTSHAEKIGYCSKSCRGKPKLRYKCLICKKSDFKTDWKFYCSKKHFCSKKCSGIYHRGKNNVNWKGGYLSGGYKCIQIETKPIREHRYIMQNYIGRKLRQNEVVHHKNGIKTDNRIKNLEVMLRSDHIRMHNLLRN